MLNTLNTLIGYKIHATDGDLGKIEDFYFDDQMWVIRYMVVNTGRWLSGREVLISSSVMGKSNKEAKIFTVDLSTDMVQKSPDTDTKKPVSRQHEAELLAYYQWPIYWREDLFNQGIYGMSPLYPPVVPRVDTEQKESLPKEEDPHLRSTKEVTGYHIQSLNDEIGHVEDFIVDEDSWSIHYLVIKTQNWLPSKKVLISPKWIKEISWENQKVFVILTSEAIKNSPEYDPSKSISANYEEILHAHYKGE
jgi:uncharacterized protein YrrD